MPYGNDVFGKCDIAKSVIHDELSVDDLTTLSSSANDLLRTLLTKDPSNRISVAEMKTHSFFRDMYVTFCLFPPLISTKTS
jgi:serine/threonine protein kinase